MTERNPPVTLRDWLSEVERIDEVHHITGAHWRREMGAISEIVEQERKRNAPAIMFDGIPGYPEGFRTLYNHLGSVNRMALSVGLPPGNEDMLTFARQFESITRGIDPIPPVTVEDGPVLENVRRGNDIALTEVPVPLHHEHDGGRYIGTACCVITRSRDGEWTNMGTYRCQVKSDDELFVYISPGKHGRLQREDYFAHDEPMPVAITFGQDPNLWQASSNKADQGVNEIAYAGGVRGFPYEVIEGKVTGLPISANAEIAVEGFIRPGQTGAEGPFGEWTGYYASGSRSEPYLVVEGMYFRDDPILVCLPPHKPPMEGAFITGITRSARLVRMLEGAGVPDVQGVWAHETGGSRQFNVVAIRQRYAGHARQAAYMATHTGPGEYAGRWTVVVDEDIDPTDIDAVTWAMCTRCDPKRDIEFVDRAWSTPLDPMIEEGAVPHNTRAVVDATIPFERLDDFPEVAETSPEYRDEILAEWEDELPM